MSSYIMLTGMFLLMRSLADDLSDHVDVLLVFHSDFFSL